MPNGDTKIGIVETRRLVGIVEGIERLPAVATLDWCDRAARVLAPVCDPAIVLVTLAAVDTHGRVVNHDCVGVGGRGVEVLRLDEVTGVGSRIATLRALASETESIIPLTVELETESGTALLGEAGSRWKDAPIARPWAGLDVAAPLVGMVRVDARTSIIVQIAPVAGQAAAGEHELMLRAILPPLARRAALALCLFHESSKQWLTVREQLVLEHLTLGKSVPEIAEAIGRSHYTVHDHVKALHRKLDASSRGQLVARALGHPGLGKIDLPPPAPPPGE